jgi:tRNA pseudouridine55 synthase
MDGMLLVDKPPGLTSHDVVQIARARLGIARVGHTGTLDPMAQGLLILLVGSATRHQQEFQGHDKTYEALLQLGAQTSTGDALGTMIRTAPVPKLEPGRLVEVLASFIGSLVQQPPAYSAIKVQGRPAYWWARRGQAVSLPSRVVRIHAMELIEWAQETVRFRVGCSSGTYVRSLGEAIAERLGTAGHVSEIVRLRIGSWALDDAHPLAWLKTATPEELAREIHPLRECVHASVR